MNAEKGTRKKKAVRYPGDRRKAFNLLTMSDEQVCEFMDSIETDYSSDSTNGDFDDDDFIGDPDFLPEDLQVANESTLTVIEATNLSCSVGECHTPVVDPDESDKENELTPGPSKAVETVSSATTSTVNSPKRPRSPLPEDDGPQFNPSKGGFTGKGLYFKTHPQFLKMVDFFLLLSSLSFSLRKYKHKIQRIFQYYMAKEEHAVACK